MKTRLDPRHKKRRDVIKSLFAISFRKDLKTKIPRSIKKLVATFPKIDKIIEKAAPGFPVEKINKIDLAILRLAVFELAFEKKEPPKVIIDEAVELGKEFGGDTSSSFINGALGKIYEREKNRTQSP